MATGSKGIATEGEAKSKLGSSASVTSNKLCTKSRALALGALEIGIYSRNYILYCTKDFV